MTWLHHTHQISANLSFTVNLHSASRVVTTLASHLEGWRIHKCRREFLGSQLYYSIFSEGNPFSGLLRNSFVHLQMHYPSTWQKTGSDRCTTTHIWASQKTYTKAVISHTNKAVVSHTHEAIISETHKAVMSHTHQAALFYVERQCIHKGTTGFLRRQLNTLDLLCTMTAKLNFWKIHYGVATISRLLKIIGLFCKRALEKRLYSAKETYNFKEPTNRSHPIVVESSFATVRFIRVTRHVLLYDVTCWHIRNDSFIRVKWLVHTCIMTWSCVWQNSFVRVILLVHMRAMFRSDVRPYSLICVTSPVHMRDMPH